jgi:hypothetical protein
VSAPAFIHARGTSQSTLLRRGFAITALFAAWFITSKALASPAYPDQLQAELRLSYVPKCSLCHSVSSSGESGPVSTPFGKSMVARGLLAAQASGTDAGAAPSDAGTSEVSLVAALAKMRTDGVDSDGDGAEDLDELTWGSDPNTYDGLKSNPTEAVNYGCAFSPAARAATAIRGLGILAALVLLGARTRRGGPFEKLRR